MPSASPLVALGMPALAIAVAGLFVTGTFVAAGRRAGLLALAGAAAWMALTGALAAAGVFARFETRPPPLVPLLVGVVSLALLIGLSPLGRRLAQGLPLWALVGFQAFRLPLELVMHRAAEDGVMPVQMSYSGLNLDILTGAAALVLAPLLARGKLPQRAAAIWNVAGALLLINIVTIAVLSTPVFAAFRDTSDRLNTWVTQLPYVWLPAVLVCAAMAGHLVVARKLRAGT